MCSPSGIIQAPSAQNIFTISDTSQIPELPDSTYPNQAGQLQKVEDTAQYSYFSGWGAQAYTQDRSHYGVPILNDYVRKMAYVSPDLFFVYDRVSTID